MDENLLAFVRAEVAKGSSRSQITEALAGAGWPSTQVQEALIALGVPHEAAVPTTLPATSPEPEVDAIPAAAEPQPQENAETPPPIAVPPRTAGLGATVAIAGIVLGVTLLGGVAWYFISLQSRPSLTATDDWNVVSTEPLVEYRSEMLGIAFTVPERVRVKERSLGKYGTLEFFIGKKFNEGESVLSRTDFAVLYVNKPKEEFDYQVGTQTLAGGAVVMEGKVRDSVVGGERAQVYSMRTRSDKYKTDVERDQGIQFTHDGNLYTLGITGNNTMNDEDRELYKHILGTFSFFPPTKPEFANATREEFEASNQLDLTFGELINRAAVFGEVASAQGNPERGYGKETNDCFATEGIFSDQRVRGALEGLRAAGAKELSCYASPEGFAISVKRPESASAEGAYKCQDNESGTTGQCGVAAPVSGPGCGQCIDACNGGPEDLIC